MRLLALLLFMLNGAIFAESFGQSKKIELLMPGVTTHEPEAYYCTSLRLDPNTDYYIVGFEPKTQEDRVHHLLLFACASPGSSEEIWPCGLMSNFNADQSAKPVCSEKSMVMYAWTSQAEDLQLPEGVAFHVGRNTHWRHLVLQIHYAQPTSLTGDGTPDESGVIINYDLQSHPRNAGVFVLGTGGVIPARSRENMEVDCQLQESVTLHPFAFRVHTHSLGEVVAGYKVEKSSQGGYHPFVWTLLGKMDPQLPQMFYPIATNTTLSRGDILAARCTMYNYRHQTTVVGLTSKDEMCNFYIMYWTMGDLPSISRCGSLGPPRYYWQHNGGLENIPEDASSINHEFNDHKPQTTTIDI